ncbi:MAG TPA: tripartite tricarboxylate transporter substrate binding protein [Burkholderiales bacterium]|nr:tripartite tricarboxylate transporter substrate binding protein [Burkholderiales bacterium]
MKLLLVAALLFCSQASAQSYPSRAVKMVVPFPAGSATDQIARVVGQQLQESLGQPFVVENKPGAQGAIAATEVARAAPDGYTLMVGTNTPLAANPSLFKKLNYDPDKDFAPIARLGTISFMIMVRPEFPAKTFKEFLAHAKANPGKLSAGYGSAGSQVSQAMLRSMGRIDFIDVPYKGLPQAITDVLGGQVSFTFADLANALAQIKGGKLRGIAVTSQKRSALAPDIPAVAEELPGYELIAWFALVAPAGTPAPVVSRLHDVTVKALAKPEVGARFAALGTDVAPLNADELGAFIRSEIAKWAKMAKEAGIQPE